MQSTIDNRTYPPIARDYFLSLKQGDIVTGIGPLDDFHIKPA
jgi:hypothetical protein